MNMNKNRIKCLRKLHDLSQADFAKKYNVAQTAVSNWEQGRNSIDISTASQIAQDYKVPVEFVYGFDFEITIPVDKWHTSVRQDMEQAPPVCRDYFLYKFGKGVFNTDADDKKEPSVTIDGEPEEDVIIFHRNGKTQRRKFTKDQMAMLMAMIDAIPNTPKDDI